MEPGGRIGSYRVVRKLGAGAMGAVFQAEHALIGRSAAIKTLLPELSEQHEAVGRFFNEARATSSIADPGIVQLFDFGFHADGTAYIVMEFLEGESLEARIERRGRIPPAEALRIVAQAASSLAAAHACGIVHRDIKPDNIFMVRDPVAQGGERPKILDFGIAKLDREIAANVTQNGTMLGTPMYMPPEQARGAERVDGRADVYSLGCVLFHMLTGRLPFDRESGLEIIAAHLGEQPPAPSKFVPDLDACVDELVLRCLEKDPDDRMSSMSELQVECAALIAQLDSHAVTPRATLAPPPKRSRFRTAPGIHRRSTLAAALLLLGAMVIFLIALQLTADPTATAAAVAAPAPAVPAIVTPPAPPAIVVTELAPEPAAAPPEPAVNESPKPSAKKSPKPMARKRSVQARSTPIAPVRESQVSRASMGVEVLYETR